MPDPVSRLNLISLAEAAFVRCYFEVAPAEHWQCHVSKAIALRVLRPIAFEESLYFKASNAFCAYFHGCRQEHAHLFHDAHRATCLLSWSKDQKSICASMLAIVQRPRHTVRIRSEQAIAGCMDEVAYLLSKLHLKITDNGARTDSHLPYLNCGQLL